MAVRTREEVMEMIRERIGEDTSDSALAIIEDLTDTLDDYDARIADSGDWRARYEENDAAWRQRYRDRFFGTGTDDITEEETAVEEPAEAAAPTTFEELFKEQED